MDCVLFAKRPPRERWGQGFRATDPNPAGELTHSDRGFQSGAGRFESLRSAGSREKSVACGARKKQRHPGCGGCGGTEPASAVTRRSIAPSAIRGGKFDFDLQRDRLDEPLEFVFGFVDLLLRSGEFLRILGLARGAPIVV